MKILLTEELSSFEKELVLSIWNNEYAEKLVKTMEEFEVYLSKLGKPQHFLMYNNENSLCGWAVSFDRDGERWFAILLDSSAQKKGYGTRLLNILKEHEPVLNGWVTDHDKDMRKDGRPYLSPMAFYLKNGFEILKDIRLETAELSAVKIHWKNRRLTKSGQPSGIL